MRFFRFWKYILIFILLLFFYPCIPTPLLAQPIKFGQYYALLIANQKYTDWKQLTTPLNDVHELEKVLRNKYKFTRIDVLEDVTRDEIIDRIELFKGIVTDSDNLLIYYAGHGTLRGRDGYWIGIDARQESSSRWLHLKRISELIDPENGMKARHVLIIADSCYAGAFFRSPDNNDALSKNTVEKISAWFLRKSKESSRTAFTSGGMEPVLDHINGSRHSIFANKLINRLKKNGDVIDMRSLARKVSQEVQDKTYYGNSTLVQTPEYASLVGLLDDGGDFIFVPNGTTVDLPEVSIFGIAESPTKGTGTTVAAIASTREKNSLMWSTLFTRKMNWNEAKAYCKSYNGSGQSNWRLPTLEELKIANKNAFGVTDQEVWAEKNNKPAYFNFEFGEGKSNVGSNYSHYVLCIAD